MKIAATLIAMLMAFSVSNAAFAHADHDDAPALSLKLVNKKGSTQIQVSNGGEKVSTAGATGKLTFEKAGAKHDVELVPSGKNAMVTKPATTLTPGSKAQATVTLADKRVGNAVFDVK